MEPAYAARSQAVADALVAAYRPWVEQGLRRHGIAPEMVGTAIDAGEADLGRTLSEWAGHPASGQRSTPMELFRAALSPPTEALRHQGVPPVERDESVRRMLPGDLYDLAPASAAELGDAVGRTVAAWGIARAGEVAGVVPAAAEASSPDLVALFGTDVMDRARVAAAAEAAGLRLAVWRNPAAVDAGLAGAPPRLVLVDLTHPAAVETLTRLAAAGVEVVAFGPHVDTDALEGAASFATTEALPRSRFFARLDDLLTRRG